MTTAFLLDHVSAYAAAVREHLRDLSPEQVDDLTDGLEADLAAALDDLPATPPTTTTSGDTRPFDLRDRFGTPADYAAELRAAAGLTPPPAPTRYRQVAADRRAARRERWRRRAARVSGAVVAHPSWPAVRDFLLTLRPAWWLLRGWVWFVVALGLLQLVLNSRQVFLPYDLFTFLLLAAAVVLSVNVGRGLVGGTPRVRRGLHLAGVGAAVLAVPLLLALAGRVDEPAQVVYADGAMTQVPTEDGVWVDGTRVSNLFVYGPDGERLDGVQIFDDRGRPVLTVGPDDWNEWTIPGLDEAWSFEPAQDEDGRPRWNVYPLRGAPTSEWGYEGDGYLHLPPEVAPELPPVPFAAAPAVVVPGVVAEPAPDSAPTPTGTPAPDVVPSPEPTPAPAETPEASDESSEPLTTPSPAAPSTP